MNTNTNTTKTYCEQLMEKDCWHASELGLSVSAESSHCQLQFSNINPYWLKEAAKQLIYQQALTKTYETCNGYLKTLTSFGYFITRVNVNIKPEDINRKLMVDYLHDLCARQKLRPGTVRTYLSRIGCFFEISLREKSLPLSNEPLIFKEDFPRAQSSLPKFIPEIVIQQLLKNLNSLPESDQNLLILFLETGRRCSEVFTLPYHCLQQDNVGDYFMKVEDRKMKQTLLIPVSNKCVRHVKLQQACVDKITSSRELLFVIKRKDNIHQIKSDTVISRLNALAKKENIIDDNGCLWHFHFHQFRHTAATRMINHGVPQHIVQRYLGHLSPEMTACYAAIHDSTLKEEFNKFQKRFSQPQEAILLKKALSDPGALTDCQQQLEATKKCIEMARMKGWKESLKRNIQMQEELEKMITTIQRGNTDVKIKA